MRELTAPRAEAESQSAGEDLGGRLPAVESLINIWSRMLRVSPILPDSNFFDLGGDSLLAVNLFLEIERETGCNFPITTIYDAPTVAELAALIEDETCPGFSPLVQLKKGNGPTPLFLVHGLGGSVIELATLGKLIRTESPVYAIQARGLDGAEPPIETVEAMADYYIDTIRQAQPFGPYLLGGYSFGGLVAFEMARRLRQAHESIAALLLIDAYAHPRTWPLKSRAIVRGRRLLKRLGKLARQPAGETISFAIDRAGKVFAGRKAAELAKSTRQGWLREIDPDLPLALRKVRYAGDAALLSYMPQFYPGKITFLRAGTTDAVFPPNPRTIWRPLAQDFEFHTIRGDHHSIIAEHAAETADRISTCLAPQSVQHRRVDGRWRVFADGASRSGVPLEAGSH